MALGDQPRAFGLEVERRHHALVIGLAHAERRDRDEDLVEQAGRVQRGEDRLAALAVEVADAGLGEEPRVSAPQRRRIEEVFDQHRRRRAAGGPSLQLRHPQRRRDDEGLDAGRGEDAVGERQAAEDRVDDVARLPRQAGELTEREQLGCRLVAGRLRAQHELGLGADGLGPDRDVAEATQHAHETLVDHAGRPAPVAAEDGQDGVVPGVAPAPGHDAVGRGHHHREDPRTVRPRRRKSDRLGDGRIGRDGAVRVARLRAAVPADQRMVEAATPP